MKLLIKKIKLNISRFGFLVIPLIKIKYKLFKRNSNLIVKKPQSSKFEIDNIRANSLHYNIAIMAVHFYNNIIPVSTTYYLKELRKNFDTIILISDQYIEPKLVNPIIDIVDYALFENHNEYDFGSYKRGIQFVKQKKLYKNAQNLLLCNDSVFGPITNLKETINKMNKKTCDFWGLVESKDIRPHLQSWFLYFKKRVLDTEFLYFFLSKVREEKIVWDIIIKYETKITSFLSKKGFKYSSLVPSSIKELNSREINAGTTNKTVFPLYLMAKYNFPFIKKKFFTKSYDKYRLENKQNVIDIIGQRNQELKSIIIKEIKI